MSGTIYLKKKKFLQHFIFLIKVVLIFFKNGPLTNVLGYSLTGPNKNKDMKCIP